MARCKLSLSLMLIASSLWAAGCGQMPLGASGSAVAATDIDASAKAPGWLEGAVVYGVVPPLFGESPLRDVTAKLDTLKDMGYDAIWLSPVNTTDDQSMISYAVSDYMGLREDFGTKADFKALTKAAHARGIKVLMDFVPNHTSDGHPFYKQAEKEGPTGKFWNFYQRDAQGKAENYFDWKNLKNLNFSNPAVQQHVTEAFTYWLKDMDVDGFRVDAAWGVKDRNPAFWPALAKSLKKIKPDVFMLAEASARDAYYTKNGFDAAYDWGKELGHWSWEKVWDTPLQAGDALRSAMAGRETSPDRVARFLNNNDTGVRFISRYGVPAQRVAAVMLHTLPGIPVVYTGDEVGAEFEPYEDPAPLTWQDPHKLRPLYKSLAGLRGSVPALRKGNFSELKPAKAPGVYAFVREAGASQVLVACNYGKAVKVTLPLPTSLRGQTLTDALTGKSVALGSGATVTLEMGASSALVLTQAGR